MAKKKTEKKEDTTEVVEKVVTTEPVTPIDIKKDFTLIEKYQEGKNQNIAIRVFFDQTQENMGLENYAMSLFEGVVHEEELTCLEVNGIKRYLTGLNEFAPEVKKLPKEKREAKIREIRKAVAQLEADLAANIIEADDPEFWNKVKLLRHDNHEFWGKISLRIGNEPVYLDPSTDPYDLIKLYAIEAGGFSIVAPSLRKAKQGGYKFFLDKLEDTVSSRTEISKIRNRALSALSSMYDSNNVKLFYVAKVVDADSVQYNKSTAHDVIYENMDDFIHGYGTDNNKRRAAQSFLDASRMEMEDLKLRSAIKDAVFYSFIRLGADGTYFFQHQRIGKNTEDMLMFLKNPINQEICDKILDEVEYYWKM
tara:strand:- start:3764 stop:4858 length:1095 start_codon:yes stop_codon:yes gene_type:complete